MYRTCPEDLQFDFADSNMLVPFINLGGKTLYILIVDICDYGASASKRGPLKSHVLSSDDLRETVAATATHPNESSAAGACD